MLVLRLLKQHSRRRCDDAALVMKGVEVWNKKTEKHFVTISYQTRENSISDHTGYQSSTRFRTWLLNTESRSFASFLAGPSPDLENMVSWLLRSLPSASSPPRGQLGPGKTAVQLLQSISDAGHDLLMWSWAPRSPVGVLSWQRWCRCGRLYFLWLLQRSGHVLVIVSSSSLCAKVSPWELG